MKRGVNLKYINFILLGIIILGFVIFALFNIVSTGNPVRSAVAESFSTTNTQVSTQDVLCEEEYLNSGAVPLWIGDPINKRKQILTYTDIPGLLDTKHFYGNVDAVFVQTLEIGRNKIMNSSPTQIFIEMNLGPGNSLYTYHITFNKAVDFTHPDSIGEWITLMGQDFLVGADTNPNDLVLYGSGQRVDLSIGGVDPSSRFVNIENKIYTVELISASDTSVIIEVTDFYGFSDTKEIAEYTSKKIQGLEVAVALADETNLVLTAQLAVGAERLELTHGTLVKVGSDENPLDGALVSLAGGTTWRNASLFAIYFFAPDSDHDKIFAGQTWANPVFRNLKLIFESYSSTNGAIIKIGGCVWNKPCLDSDGGNVPLTRGTMTYWVNNWTDSCSGTSSLSEYYCSSEDTPIIGTWNCASGCYNGACKPAPTSSCKYDKRLRAYVCN